MKTSLKRILVIIAAGICVAVAGDRIMSHPYFDMIFWPQATFSELLKNNDHELLLRAACSPFLPRRIRQRAFKAAVHVRRFSGQEVSLPNRQISRLMVYFSDDDYSMLDYMFHQPFLEGQMNPDLVAYVCDTSLTDLERAEALQRLMEARPMTVEMADDIFRLWDQVHLGKYQEVFRESLVNPPRCCNPEAVPSNLVHRFQMSVGEP